MSNIDNVKTWLTSLQNRICAELETLDGKASFVHDKWDRPGGGGGEIALTGIFCDTCPAFELT